jgi:hypothetical protein
MNKSDFLENRLTDGIMRGGALTSGGLLSSSAVVKGVWAATTAYLLGDVVVPGSGFTGAGGKFLQCTSPGTTGSTSTLAVPNPGSTLTDGGVTWTAVSGIPSPLALYMALFVINKGLRLSNTAYSTQDVISLAATGGSGGDTRQHLYRCTTAGTTAASQGSLYQGVPGEAITDGTAVFTEISPVFDSNTGFPTGLAEVSGGSYARVKVSAGTYMALGDWAGTQGSGTTTASTGSSGTTSNNGVVTFAAPTANWASGSAQVGACALYDQLTGGNLYYWAPLNTPKTVNSGDAAPSFAASAFSIQDDN